MAGNIVEYDFEPKHSLTRSLTYSLKLLFTFKSADFFPTMNMKSRWKVYAENNMSMYISYAESPRLLHEENFVNYFYFNINFFLSQ